MEGKLHEAAHGVFSATLIEDMVTTVQRTGQLYCDAVITDYYDMDSGHPLVRVPLWAMSLPLKKDDKVLVEFFQDDLTLPVLYKPYDEIDEGFYKKFELGSSVSDGNITVPKSQETVSAQKLGDDSYIINTNNYTVIHRGSGFILIDNEGNHYVKGPSVNIIGTDSVNIDTQKLSLKNTTTSLYKILTDALNILNTSLATQGSPASHVVVPHQFDLVIQELNNLME